MQGGCVLGKWTIKAVKFEGNVLCLSFTTPFRTRNFVQNHALLPTKHKSIPSCSSFFPAIRLAITTTGRSKARSDWSAVRRPSPWTFWTRKKQGKAGLVCLPSVHEKKELVSECAFVVCLNARAKGCFPSR